MKRLHVYQIFLSLLLAMPTLAQESGSDPTVPGVPPLPDASIEPEETTRTGLEFFDADSDGSVYPLEVIETIWYFPLYDSGGGEPVRLNRIVIALLMIVLGIWLSHRLTMIARSRLVRFPKMTSQVAAVIQKLLFYALAVVVGLIVLPFLGIPTTIFTVIGGGLAIGLGFGAQKLIANLIAGIIIMAERPVRLGDIVLIDDDEGRVEEIGSRATRVRRSDGIDVILPNSMFLDEPVVNWTLSDRDVRCTVKVGIAYGSPTQKASELIRQAVNEHDRVLPRPEPVVLFEDFGDNALLFNVVFWTQIAQPMDRRRIESEVRYRIDALLREAKITIAFPQRDVHLNGAGPIEVTVTKNTHA